MNPSTTAHRRTADHRPRTAADTVIADDRNDALDEERWAAVQRRDAAYDGRFVYAVRTTGVYCRPSCPSRPARRENVSFHADGAAAERAGFRACLRCRPGEDSPAERQAAVVAAACRQIEAAETPPTLEALAAAAGLSRYHFHRLFRAVTGVTPRDYAAALRQRRVQQALPASRSVTEALYDAGFGSSGGFYAAQDQALGMPAGRYRRGGERERIRFALGRCALGEVLVAATDRGVCAILLGDDPEALLRELQDRFPKAELIGADAGFERTVAIAVGLVEGQAEPGAAGALPLDIRGTAFQRQVWQALRGIPAGETTTYTALAERIGAPAAVRAVASACAANPLAVAIPCHRVVRRDGALAGYRWGLARKRSLLEREGALDAFSRESDGAGP